MSSFEFFPEDSPRTISDPSQALMPEDIAVPMFRGVGHEVINAPLRGGASLLQAGALAAGGVDAPIDYLLGTHLSDGAFAVADRARAYREAHTLQPDEVGMASRIVGGAGEFLTQLALTGPAGAIGALELNTSADLARSGVDPFTSVAAGMTEAEGLALAFHIPGMGRGLASRVGLGVTANVGAGVLSRGAVGELLDQSGNPEQAKQFSAWNGEQMAVDAITGAFFGGVTHYQQRAAFAAINDHVQRVARSAPGEPLTADALDMHADRLDTAMQQVLADEPVTVSMPPGKFAPDPQREAMRAQVESEVRQLFTEEGAPPEVVAGPAPTAERLLYAMTQDEIFGLKDAQRTGDLAVLAEALGDEGKANKVLRGLNSNNDRLFSEAEAVVEALPDAVRAKVEQQIYQTGHSTDAVSDYEQAATAINVADTPEEMAKALRVTLTDIREATPENIDKATHSEQVALWKLRYAMERIKAEGWDQKAISEEAVKQAAARFSDPVDAEFMLRRFVQPEQASAMPTIAAQSETLAAAGEAAQAPTISAAEADAIASGDQRLPPDATHPEAQQDEFLVAHVRKIMGERAAVGRDIGEIVRDDGTTVDAHVALAEADADVRAAHELDAGARALANCEISHRGL